MSNEVLIVVSKLKNYIKSAAEMNTSGNLAPAMSNIVRELCERAIQNAQNDGRKTVMDRDFEFANSASGDGEVLVVVSKLKSVIKDMAGLNTSGNVAPALSGIIRNVTNQAIENARNDNRKTVMDRDLSNIIIEPVPSQAA
ncbi:MAG: hypothetical protein KDD56_02890 [Bdellovibrionales bacterium]|nr:hypothetical protein [Bdellovibrionales bacterium]